MIFDKYYQKFNIFILKDYYIEYKILKNKIKNNINIDSLFLQELESLHKNIDIIKKNNKVNNKEINDFLILNYMIIFNIISSFNKNKKNIFFSKIKNNNLYSYYISIPREIHNKTDLVIFDKDGTLIDQNAIFSPWVELIVKKLCKIFECALEKEMFNYLGYNYITKQFTSNSIVARGTNTDIINSIIKFYQKNNIKKNSIKEIIENNWEITKLKDNNGYSSIIPCGNIKKVFKYLKLHNIKVAICTNDDRVCTKKTIDYLNIGHLIDYVICGDDQISTKPSPEPIWKICQELFVNINNTIMVGDTISDINAGINAKCGLVVGVLSGNYSDYNLNKADKVIKNIDHIYPLINI